MFTPSPLKFVTGCSGMGNVAMTFFFWFFWACIRSHGTATSTTSSLSLRLDPTGREFPSPLVTVFDVPVASMRASARPNCLCVVLILYLVWMCAGGASSCPPYKCLALFYTKVCFIDLRYGKRCDDFFFWFFFGMSSVSRDGDIYDVLSVSALGPNRA